MLHETQHWGVCLQTLLVMQEKQGGLELQQLLQEARLQQAESEKRLADAQTQLAHLGREAAEAAAFLHQHQAEIKQLR